MADDDMTELLHSPGRLKCLNSLEYHIATASWLARAMWLAASTESQLEIDREGLRALAGVLADHASAANYLFSKGEGK
ncbi:MAG: hypothetical protein WBO09_02725 [Methylocystis silviterrae]|uniref:hypothetical protein n=1 Tax=Methylocystis silviterrae TaxID=2743612 RepID=UPI003C707C69